MSVSLTANLIMKIAEIKTHSLRCRLEDDEAFGYSQAWFQSRASLIVEIITDDGITGWGEAFGPPEITRAVVDHAYKPLFMGRDPFDVDVIWQELYNTLRDHGQKGVVIEALSAVDIALWDIMGKAVNLPVHKLLGGCHRDRVKAYATGMYRRRSADSPEILAQEAAGYVEQGFLAVKMKVGLGVERDLENVKAVRNAIGDHILLMVDANHAYDARSAITLGKKMEEYGVYWFEEPVPPEDIEGYLEVKRALNMFIAGGEAEFTRFGFKNLISRKAVDIVQPDCCAAGGLSEVRNIAVLANTWNIQCWPHVWGTGVAIAAALHLLAALPDSPPSLTPLEPMLELDRTPNRLREETESDLIQMEEGYIRVPTGPGLGINLDRGFIDKYVVKNL
jgi:D-galactarolactone cycloisomerase